MTQRYYIILSNGLYVHQVKKNDIYVSIEKYSVDHENMVKITQKLNSMKERYEVIEL